ncbi:MAG: hypothetical protein ACKODS_02975, partial [Methylophilaceae bacterium]
MDEKSRALHKFTDLQPIIVSSTTSSSHFHKWFSALPEIFSVVFIDCNSVNSWFKDSALGHQSRIYS